MSQKTNLNVSPYYDDFEKDNNFYRVLFKPGFPVQSRELTTLQSILQNQIESFGNHIFKDGSVVIPGNVTYNSEYYAVKINPTHVGLSVGLYLRQLIGKKILGQTSQLTAIVQNVITDTESEDDTYTIYVKYITSDSNFSISQFRDGETLVLLDSLTYGNTTISSGNTFATLVNLGATSIASSVSISSGIYYIRGHFVSVSDHTIILDQYSNTPSYRVGLNILEEIIDAQEDNSLYDNARGFSNYAAPGADRLKISATLTKKRLTDLDDKNFVEVLRVSNGVVKKIQDTNSYSLIKDYIAKRTYEESGDYAVTPFNVEVTDSLNDRVNSDGTFFFDQKTDQGNTPSEDLISVKVSPGKAYVRGFDVEKTVTTILDVDKPRDTITIPSSSVPFEMGNLLKVNNVSGSPIIGINNNYSIYLNNKRKNSNIIGAGTTIGKARVYSFGLSDAPYQDNASNWDLYLYDIQTYTTLTLNQSLSTYECPETSYIKGVNSGASGYVVGSPDGNKINVQQTSGSFSVGEEVLVNGSSQFSRSIAKIDVYGVQDIKSVYQDAGETGLSTSFVADTFLQKKIASNFSNTDFLSISATGVATCPGRIFTGIKSDTIIRYQIPGNSLESFNRVQSVSSDGLTLNLTAVSNVSGVCTGTLPSSTVFTTFSIGVPSVQNEEKSYLYAKLDAKNVSDVNLVGSDLTVKRQASGRSSNSVGNLAVTIADVGISSAYFEPYDEERYSVIYSDGTVDQLTPDKVSLTDNSTVVSITGLRPNQTNIIVNTTVRKNSIRSKQKLYVRSKKLEIIRTSSGISTNLSGLTTSNYYGLRVEDDEISLNVPDVSNIIAIYESIDENSVVLDALEFSSGLNLDTSSILGERIVGSTSGAVGQIVTRSSSTKVEFVYLNSNKFVPNETATFEESNIVANIASVITGNYVDKTQDYILNKGQKDQYYDYSRIVRKNNANIPSRKILVIFDYYSVPENDGGDLYTVRSYDVERYKNDIPTLRDGVRSSDVLDFRPRVADFVSASSSPFAFSSRNFGTPGFNPTLVVCPNESSIIGYSYYLPRIDKVVISKDGNIHVIKGVSSPEPKEPSTIEESMVVATINLPAYLYNSDDAVISIEDNKRYTMRDIRKLEQRIENVEELTSLSLLELDTKTLQIQDSDGLSRFKSGFFVDNFKGTNFIDVENPDAKVSINTNLQELKSDSYTYSLKAQVAPRETININTADFGSNIELLDSSVRKTGDLVTLNYSEVKWNNISQIFATKDQQVNPFGIVNYNGFVKLTPSSDTWARTLNSENGVIIRSQSEWEDNYISSIISSSIPKNKLRSRNVEFRASGLRPSTNYYSFFGGNSNIDIIPKLIQISMNVGVFQSGETVFGYLNGQKVSAFRVANSDHKSGAYNSPLTTYSTNPYATSLSIDKYSSSSSVLNIDTYSLADDSEGRFYGYIRPGMILVGETSAAQATVSSQSLTSDPVGDLIGCFFIRNPFTNPTPDISFNTGSKTFKLSSSSSNSTDLTVSFTESTFYGTGIVDTTVYTESLVVRRSPAPLPLNAVRRDPLTQTFRTDNEGGFITSVDLYFSGKDSTEKLFVEIRETDIGGVPKNKLVQDFSRVEVSPAGITTSSDGSVSTNIKFPSPVYLQPNKQYALSLICPSSDDYKVWIAESNQATVSTQSYPNAQQVIYSNQYTGGNLYKPQNGSIWNSSISEDLTFSFYKANFSSSTGTAYFYNPTLSIGSTFASLDANVPLLTYNPIKVLPRKLVVGVETSQGLGDIFTPGRKVAEDLTYGYIENVGGNIGVVTTTSVGIGYSNGVYTNIPLYTINGSGSGATADFTIINNQLTTVSIATTGTGYKKGDLLGITTSSVSRGRDATITVQSIDGIDTIFITNVQGEDFSAGSLLSYYEGDTLISLAGTVVRGNSYVPNDIYRGNVFEVTHYSHGMQSNQNVVNIGGVSPNTSVELLTANIVSTNTAVSVANTAKFLFFEGRTVSASNPGYVIINDEIIKYTSVSQNLLNIAERGSNESTIRNHFINDRVYKYELNGVSLTRINNSHTLPTNQTLRSLRDIDKYHIEFDRTGRSSANDMLNFVDERVLGGSNCRASQNIQFSEIIPQFNVLTPENTNISSTLRTVTGTSSGGSEASFIDKGFEPVSLNELNILSSPRVICSRINEATHLSALTRNKSLTLGIRMETTNSNVSPVIDLSESATFVVARNRINNPIESYVKDPRSNQLNGDPHSSVYISKRVDLVQPATSLKVLLTAYRHSSSDFRVLYRLFRSDSSEISQSYELFPGYKNLRDTDGDGIGDTVIDTNLNDGAPDVFVSSSTDDEFLEYQFTADNLEQFNGFVIKIVMSGTNEARTPKFKDLRAIALA
jgi:hypothetical protein